MTDYRSLFDASFLYAFDLKGRDVTVTIGAVKVQKLENNKGKAERKPVVFFKESHDGRGLVANRTNCKTIARMYGNDIEGWVDKRVTLYAARVEAFGETMDAIRIRPTPPNKTAKVGEFLEVESRPAPELPDPDPLHEPPPARAPARPTVDEDE